MGLDMYLEGRKFLFTGQRSEDDRRMKEVVVDLGYWRKHPNLHGFIVETFAKGVDECQRIELGRDQIEKVIVAIQTRSLPHTEGFFFGKSEGSEEEMREDIKIFMDALTWLKMGDTNPDEIRSVVYQASW